MFFGWSKTFGLDGARIGHLTRRLASELNVLYGDVWIESATYKNISERELLAKVLFFPPSPKQRWDKAQITSLDDRLVNKTIKLLGYDPYGLISSNLRTLTNPLSSGIGKSHIVPLRFESRRMPTCGTLLLFSFELLVFS